MRLLATERTKIQHEYRDEKVKKTGSSYTYGKLKTAVETAEEPAV